MELELRKPDLTKEQILVIKHGALGDVVLCSGALKSIREHHADGEITLLTTRAYAPLLDQSGYFDHIWIDNRPKLHNVFATLAHRKQLRSGQFARVYDLQTSTRSSSYFWLMKPHNIEWSGIAKGASHVHNSAQRTSMHTIDRQAEQLRIAGISSVYPPDISWMKGQGDIEGLDAPYAILIPGGSAHRPEKRYPEEHYITLARLLAKSGIRPILIGGGAEDTLLERIAQAVPQALNLCNATSLGDIADIARGAAYAVGNDTGPLHIVAATGCRSVALFSYASNPDLCAPRGEHVSIMREEDLSVILPEEILSLLQ